MQPFIQEKGKAAPFPAANVDTDVIMPKQFLKGIDREGLDRGVFHALRFAPSGQPRPEFILNRPEWAGAKFLVAGPNFGCGSSREHAVWGLAQLGIRALIGTSFAGIFNDNCVNNGILTITLPEAAVAVLLVHASRPDGNEMIVDLADQTIRTRPDGDGPPTVRFAVEPLVRERLMAGLDAVAATLRHSDAIIAFERGYGAGRPWLGMGE